MPSTPRGLAACERAVAWIEAAIGLHEQEMAKMRHLLELCEREGRDCGHLDRCVESVRHHLERLHERHSRLLGELYAGNRTELH